MQLIRDQHLGKEEGGSLASTGRRGAAMQPDKSSSNTVELSRQNSICYRGATLDQDSQTFMPMPHSVTRYALPGKCMTLDKVAFWSWSRQQRRWLFFSQLNGNSFFGGEPRQHSSIPSNIYPLCCSGPLLHICFRSRSRILITSTLVSKQNKEPSGTSFHHCIWPWVYKWNFSFPSFTVHSIFSHL